MSVALPVMNRMLAFVDVEGVWRRLPAEARLGDFAISATGIGYVADLGWFSTALLFCGHYE